METTATNILPILEIEKCPAKLYGVELTDAQKQDYCQGKEIFLKNMNKDGKLLDGKVQLFLDKNGDHQNKVNFKKETLEIPKEIFGKKLTKQDIDELHKGNEVKLNTDKGEYFVKIDKDLNNVVVKSKKEITNVPEIGGYKLTSAEQKDLLAGSRLDTKVFKSKNGVYFTANVELSPDKKGLLFSNPHQITKEEAIKLIPELNKQPEPSKPNLVESIIDTGKDTLSNNENKAEKSKSLEPDKTINITTDQPKEKEASKAIPKSTKPGMDMGM